MEKIVPSAALLALLICCGANVARGGDPSPNWETYAVFVPPAAAGSNVTRVSCTYTVPSRPADAEIDDTEAVERRRRLDTEVVGGAAVRGWYGRADEAAADLAE